MSRTPAKTRFGLAIGLVVALLGLIVARLFQITLVDGDRLAGIARRQHAWREELKPVRGAILDRSGEPLAVSVGAASVFVRPRLLPPEAPAAEIVRALDLSPQQWIRKVSSAAPFVWLKRHATPTEIASIERLDVPGVGTVPERRRFYPRGRLASPVVGFAGIDSQGLEGIELAYDSVLRGSATEIGVERDALGRKIFASGLDSRSRRGADVSVTLDSALQYAAERELDRQVAETRARGGLVLMLDPHTGEVLALAQNPSFDPNDLASASPGQWRNRAITDSYEPGSTLKGLLAAAALEEGVASRTEALFCEEGNFRIGRSVIHDHHGYGWLTFERVFHVSSNICSAKIGERLGARRYGDYLRAFGLGRRTGIDLAGEQAGILRPAATWKPIELATISFGQGVSVTPLQLATAYATLANGGLLVRPWIVQRVVDEDGAILFENRPKVVRRVVSEATARVVTEILEGVVSAEGTARLAMIPGVRVAGKTGTAQKVDLEHGGYSRGRIASFIGYFPAEDPRVVLLVIIDEPQTTVWGGTAAAPVFRAVGLAAAERFGMRREPSQPAWGEGLLTAVSYGTTSLQPNDPAASASYLGLSLREALARARSEGLAVEVSGRGYVVRQEPKATEAILPGQTLRLELAPAGEASS